jgi:hypothetical protein
MEKNLLRFRKETTMRHKITLTITVLALVVWATSLSVYARGPSFNPAIYADGRVWSTKGLADLPPPNEHNHQSFDELFQIVNGAEGQLPVAEAAPGNPDYNGGRWDVQVVVWTEEGMEAYDPLPLLTSYADIMFHYDLGHLVIAPANPPTYFECPLLPVKQ